MMNWENWAEDYLLRSAAPLHREQIRGVLAEHRSEIEAHAAWFPAISERARRLIEEVQDLGLEDQRDQRGISEIAYQARLFSLMVEAGPAVVAECARILTIMNRALAESQEQDQA